MIPVTLRLTAVEFMIAGFGLARRFAGRRIHVAVFRRAIGAAFANVEQRHGVGMAAEFTVTVNEERLDISRAHQHPKRHHQRQAGSQRIRQLDVTEGLQTAIPLAKR